MELYGINLIDIAIVVAFVYFARDGYRKGFFALAFELSSFLVGVAVALFAYSSTGSALASETDISRSFAKVLSFLLIWLAVEAFFPIVGARLYDRLPTRYLTSKWNRAFGVVPALAETALLSGFLMTLVVSFSLPPILKQSILDSHFGGPLVRASSAIDFAVSGIFDGRSNETLSFLTVDEKAEETVKLGFTTVEAYPDPRLERELFDLVNGERVRLGLEPLSFDGALVDVARGHGGDMLMRGYFSHGSPEGANAADRAMGHGVRFEVIGENLAFAPTVELAHQGLMKSPRHRDNILSPEFGRVGIGVMNAGANGIMFVQNFAD